MSRSAAPAQLVIDSSALVEVLLGTAAGERVERVVGDASLIAPDVLNPEVMQSLRGLERAGKLASARAAAAMERLIESDIARVPTRMLLRDVWSLRANVSAHDGCYVALARALSCPLLTLDGPLARAPQLGVTLIYA